MGFVVDEVALGQVSLSTSVSPANSHFTDCSTFIICHPGLVQWANSGRRTSGLSLTPLQETKNKQTNKRVMRLRKGFYIVVIFYFKQFYNYRTFLVPQNL
jgi:hypothetical protein